MTVDSKNSMRSAADAIAASLVRKVGAYENACGGIPLRLHIAAQFMAPFAGKLPTDAAMQSARSVLELADALIAAHNDTCGGDK